MRVFTDSDVVISSLLSSSGAAYFLVNQSYIEPIISSISHKELQIVVKRLNIQPKKLRNIVRKKFRIVKLTKGLKEIKQDYKNYVSDINDAHIVAGAYKAKVRYLITYNVKHYMTSRIKDDLGIIVMTPALFLQYLRSN